MSLESSESLHSDTRWNEADHRGIHPTLKIPDILHDTAVMEVSLPWARGDLL